MPFSGVGWPLEKAGMTLGLRLLIPLPPLSDAHHAVRWWVVSFEHLLPWALEREQTPPCTVSSQSHLRSVTDTTGDCRPSRAAFPPPHSQLPSQTHPRQLAPAGYPSTCLPLPRPWQQLDAQHELYLPRDTQNQPGGALVCCSGSPGPGLRSLFTCSPATSCPTGTRGYQR